MNKKYIQWYLYCKWHTKLKELIDYVYDIDSYLKTIKNYISLANNLIKFIEKKIDYIQEEIDKGNFYIDYSEISIIALELALFLRYSIEVIVSIFISNNENILNRYKKFNKADEEFFISPNSNRISKIIEKLYKNKNIDIRIMEYNQSSTLLDKKTLNVDNMKNMYSYLSELLHFFHPRHNYIPKESFNFNYSSGILDYKKWWLKKFNYDFSKLKEFYKIIDFSISNCKMNVENGKYLFIICEYSLEKIIDFLKEETYEVKKNLIIFK